MNTYGAPCNQRSGPNEPYMVRFVLWRKYAKKDKSGFLCLKCFTGRLGRKLKLSDFLKNAPINFGCFGFDCRDYIRRNK